MLLPRYSLRWLLGLMTACSVLFLVMARAYEGKQWAIAVSVAIGSLVVVAIVQGLVFLLGLLSAVVANSFRARPRPQSPFAGAAPPPQIIPPVEQD
jgi:asparagine N-glycosylation enzyme membrane subunit Stt3